MSEATHVECSCDAIEDALGQKLRPEVVGKHCKCRVADTETGVHVYTDCRVWLEPKKE